MKYRGWENFETWSAWVELTNTEPLYKECVAAFRNFRTMNQKIKHIERIMSGNLNVNFEEIAEKFNDMMKGQR